jgi:hypothetical protein
LVVKFDILGVEYREVQLTIAICLNCGIKKFGALTRCKCGFIPETAVEYCIACTFTDKLEGISLDHFSELIVLCNEKQVWTVSIENTVLPEPLLAYMKETTFRNRLLLKRSAKSGWFKTQVDYYGTGPDGLTHEVWQVGKEVSKEFCKMYWKKSGRSNGPLFAVETYEDGVLQRNFVSELLFFLTFDKLKVLDRGIDETGFYLKAINAWYDPYIDEFTKTGAIA